MKIDVETGVYLYPARALDTRLHVRERRDLVRLDGWLQAKKTSGGLQKEVRR
jgi:hypothetical protein